MAPKVIATHSGRHQSNWNNCENWAFSRSSNEISGSLPSPKRSCTLYALNPLGTSAWGLESPMIVPKQCACKNYYPEIMGSKNRTKCNRLFSLYFRYSGPGLPFLGLWLSETTWNTLGMSIYLPMVFVLFDKLVMIKISNLVLIYFPFIFALFRLFSILLGSSEFTTCVWATGHTPSTASVLQLDGSDHAYSIVCISVLVSMNKRISLFWSVTANAKSAQTTRLSPLTDSFYSILPGDERSPQELEHSKLFIFYCYIPYNITPQSRHSGKMRK